jgi:replicative DNA helicase
MKHKTSPIKTHRTCPRPECGAGGSYSVWADGTGYCHSCDHTSHGDATEEKQVRQRKEPSPMTSDLTLKTHPMRGVDADVEKFYGVQTGVSESGDPVTRVYPYPHRPKVRVLPKDFSKNFGFTNDHLFGMDKFNAGTSKFLTITEGEEDTLAAYQILGKTYPVVSLPSAGSVKSVLQNKEAYNYIKAFSAIVIATDNDEAGNKSAEILQRAFPGRCYRVNMTTHKDASAYLQAGEGSDFKFAWINRQKYVPDNVFNTTDQFEKIIRDDTGSMYLPTGIKDLDARLLGLMQGHFTVFTAPEGVGKQLPNTTLMPTPDGFVTMGNLEVGDQVFGSDGKPTFVTFVTETQNDVPCYELTFSDGTTQVAGGPHRWGVYTTDNVYKVKTTDEMLAEGVTRGEGVALYSVPICQPLEYTLEDSDLPIDPYSLGFWLGDGHSYSANISVGHEDVEQFESLFEVTNKKEDGSCFSYRVRSIQHSQLTTNSLLKNKHVPKEYFQASIRQRTELLQGMMDSDGGIEGVGCCFYTSSPELLEGFLRLARGLGYKCRSRTKQSKLYGVPKKMAYTVWFLNHSYKEVFKYKRKQDKVVNCETYRATRKTIRSITPVTSVPSRCITVDNEDHLYLCGDAYTVTHNTELMRSLEYNLLANHPTVPIAIMHLEETKKRSLLGLASYFLQKDVTLQDTETITNDKGDEEIVYLPSYKGTPEDEVLQAVKEFTARENFYQFTLSVDDDPMSILEQIRYFAEVCGCRYVFFEPIQDLAYSRQSDSSIEGFLSELSTKLARLATELGVGIVSIAHENDDGQIRDCRMIGKRASVVVKLQRDKHAEDEETKNITTLLVDKNRPVGPTGFGGMLEFNPASFTLSEKEF